MAIQMQGGDLAGLPSLFDRAPNANKNSSFMYILFLSLLKLALLL